MIQFKGDSSEQAITDSVLKQTKGTKWTLDSLVSDIVKEEYTKQDMEEFIKEDLDVLKSNRIVKLRQWASLSTEDKKIFPKGLKMILDKACQLEGN